MKRMMAGSAALALVFTHAFAQEAPVTRMVISPDGKMVAEEVNPEAVDAAEGWSETSPASGNPIQDLTDEILSADENGAQIISAPEGRDVTAEIVSAPAPMAQEPSAPEEATIPAAAQNSGTATVRAIPSPPAPPQVPQRAPIPGAIVGAPAMTGSPVTDPIAQLTAQIAAGTPSDVAADGSGEPSVDLAPRFDGQGEIARRSRLTRETETITLEMQRLEALQAVVERIGVDNAVALYPDLANTISMSPMGISARITEVTLMNELREAIQGPDEPVDAADATSETPAATGEQTIMNMPVGAPTAMSREDVMAMIQEMDETEEQPSETAPQAFSNLYVVAEIYGTSDNMIAVLRAGSELIKVREGDELPDGTTVGAISSNEVVTDFEGEERIIRLR